MLKKLLSTLSFMAVFIGVALAQNESAIKVTLTDKDSKETIPFANIVVELGGIQIAIATTNIDGEAMIKPLNPGKYVVKTTYVGYQSIEMRDVVVPAGKTVYLNIPMTAGQQLVEVEVVGYKVPLIDPDTKSGGTLTREQYQNMASKDINSVASTTAGVGQTDAGGAISMRGAREGGTVYYVDGMRVIGSPTVPQSAYEQISTITGGTPAQYGDASGGVISIITRGPSQDFSGGIEAYSSGLGEKNGHNRGLDAYGFNFLGFSLNGPLMLKKDSVNGNRPILGFTLSGQVIHTKDSDPSAVGIYQVNNDLLSELEQYPLRPSPTGTGYVLNSEYVTSDDLVKLKAKNNVAYNQVNVIGKLVYQPARNTTIILGGSINNEKSHDFVYNNALYNFANNPERIRNTWRIWGDLRQKFNNASLTEEAKSSSIIRNAYFTLQPSYESFYAKVWDDTHKDRYFDYGYIGTFTQTQEKAYTLKEESIYDLDGDGTIDTASAYFMTGYNDVSLAFSPGDVNPTGVNYTNQYYSLAGASNVTKLTDVQTGLGLVNGGDPRSVYNIWFNTGAQSPAYALGQNQQFRVVAGYSADIQRHAIQAGFEYQQRFERSYSLSALGLWTRMRQLANFHIHDLNNIGPNSAILDTTPHYLNDGVTPSPYQYYDFDRLNNGNQTQFDKSLRQKLGLDVNGLNWLDVDSYDRSIYTLDMFSAGDLLNIGGSPSVSYFGYDAYGERTKGGTNLNDFFTSTDANGNLTYQIGAYEPIYMSGWLTDKFDFKDIKFNIGVRIDRFDANQPVLKDKYLLYEAKTAGELDIPNKPTNIGDDYVVYVQDANSPSVNTIVGYRSGNTWFNENGEEVQDPSSALGQAGGQVQPYLVDPSNKSLTAAAFTDYTPQINVMPRIAFSFPISDVANFYAHYDLLTQRPPSAYNRFDPLQYMGIINNVLTVVNNPALTPQKTTDYELGYQQVLNEKKNSALTLSLYYREFKDMIQATRVVQAYPTSYTSYSNVDFGTAQGMSIIYDLRRSASGVSLNANYTLQFTNGTGSNPDEGVNLVASGAPNLKTLHPMSFEQRHVIVLTLDYRFGVGRDYHGPNITLHKGKGNEKVVGLFSDMGANLVFRAYSGTPYSRQKNVTPEAQFGIGGQNVALDGSINGSNLPWNYRMDFRVDKNVELTWGGKKEGESKKRGNLNIYLQVLNLLNTKNILNVYHYTGDPDDDGYLQSPGAQATINAQNSPESFRDLYTVKLNSPGNYSRAREIRLGLLFDF